MTEQNVQIRIEDAVLKGTYANFMQVAHTKDEFVLDFGNLYPPQGIINARIITSPGHFKRVVKAMQEALSKYEEEFGQVTEANSPGPVGFAERK
ncbi:MAG: DUF3467 domain-containing protein [Candidatus Komeilibacteria bacterium]|nr:DUF3467 domain-containing protein [Candidatus Komeilibacteria bacterium]